MPCYEPLPTPEDLITSEKEKNLLEHGLVCTNNELIAMLINIACEMGILFSLIMDIQKYYQLLLINGINVTESAIV
jgi:hypothetical protein